MKIHLNIVFIQKKNNIYYFNFFDNYLETLVNFRDRAIGLYFNNESNIDIKYLDNASVDNKTINTKKYYIIYHRDFSNNYGNNKDSISLNIKGNFDFCDLVLLDTTNTTSFSILKTFEKVFLYKHDFNLIDKIESLDNSINTFLTPNYDASFNNLNITKDISLNQKLFVQNDVSLNSKLFVQNDVSLNSKLFVQNDLTVEGNATFNNTIKGNAETATALKTTRNIGGVSFDGTANIDLPGVNTTGNQDTSGSSGSCTGNAETATLATKANTLSQGGNNGTAMTFNWVPQTGQPSYLWGGSNNGTDIYVYSPSNFNVKYANTAGRSDSINGYVINQNLREMDNVKFHSVSVKYTGNQWWGANNYYTVIWDFTGSHGNINNFNFNVNIDYNGLIVSCTDQYINKDYSIKPKISESLPLTKLTNIENDKSVFGVVAYQPDASYNINNFKVNSLGEGAIWIVNKNGNLEIGDYISSSTITGYGQKQNDDLLHNYTVAKITCNCDFSLKKKIKQKIITISNENYIEAEYKEIGSSEERDLSRFINYDENGNIQYEDDLDLSGNQVYEYKFDTRFLDASSNILSDEEDYLTRLNNGENVYIACFVGCTYHCG